LNRENRLRAVVDTAVDGVILIDSIGNILMFNPACEKLFGYVANEVIGHNVKMLMPAPYREEHDRYLDNYHRTGERKIIGIGREVMGCRKDGSTFPMTLSVGQAEEAGKAIFVGVIHDLTERERRNQELRDAAARLRAVVDTAVDGVILIDATGKVLMFNPACERLFGYRTDEVIGQNVKMLMPSPYREEHDQYIENYRSTGERKIIGIGREVVGRRRDGSTFPMDLSVGEAKLEGESTFVGIIHDLTDRKKTEEQLVQAQKMETVGQLSGGIAHDFNNLLTVIIGNGELLKEKMKSRADLRQICDSIIGAGDRGAELTRRLLAFSRRQTLKPTIIDCNALVEGMRLLLRRTLREDIEITTSLDPDIWAGFADVAQLESAILNLALNAQDAMPGGGTLTISTGVARLDEHYRDTHPEVVVGDYVLIAVTDDGEGMTEEVRLRVFEPFFTTKDVGKGSGLGLSMVYGFIKQSNGHVAIYSELGLGTTVRLYLPISQDSAAEAERLRSHEEQSVPRGVGTILVVEDDVFVREHAVIALQSLGYRVIAAQDGREAIAKLDQGHEIDLLFSDVVMPGGISGWDLADIAQQKWPHLKILLSSGYSLETLASRRTGNANLRVLDKPYRKADLARSVREIFAVAKS
jgi:PAS domain S-box-containing protein